jgi:hypothetical protein
MDMKLIKRRCPKEVPIAKWYPITVVKSPEIWEKIKSNINRTIVRWVYTFFYSKIEGKRVNGCQ